MGTLIVNAFDFAILLIPIAIAVHLGVLIALRRRNVPISFGGSRSPAYLYRLCQQLPPTAENILLARLARWSGILAVFAFLIIVITGPLLSQVPK